MKVELAIGGTALLVGLSLMVAGKRMCRVTCWADDIFRYLLPSQYEFLAGGLPWVLVGLAIIGYTVLRR
jgi:hypothetical protein